MLIRTHLGAALAGILAAGLVGRWSGVAGLPGWADVVAALLAGALAGLLFGVRATGGLQGAVANLAALVDQIRAGRPHQVLLEQPEELRPLAHQLGQLAEHFQGALQEANRRQGELSAILAGLADGCIAVDPQGRILLFNRAAARLFGVSEQEALGQPLVQVVRSYDLVTTVQEALASGKPQVKEFRLGGPEERVLQVSVTLLAGPGGSAGAVALVRDVSELRRLERVRTDFVANVSHELRTPLTAIKGFIEALQEGAAQDESTRQHFLEIMARETDRLVHLINDLLDLSRLELRAAPFEPRPVPLERVARAVVPMFAQKAERKGLQMVTRIPEDLPPILGDEDMLRQILINLLDNAVKYTHRGEIRLEAHPATRDGRPVVVVSVADTGIGIPRQHLGRIFERFYRVDRARSRELGGTGLGLSIVRHAVELHGGRIEVDSEVGVGSTFRVQLPAAPEGPWAPA